MGEFRRDRSMQPVPAKAFSVLPRKYFLKIFPFQRLLIGKGRIRELSQCEGLIWGLENISLRFRLFKASI